LEILNRCDSEKDQSIKSNDSSSQVSVVESVLSQDEATWMEMTKASPPNSVGKVSSSEMNITVDSARSKGETVNSVEAKASHSEMPARLNNAALACTPPKAKTNVSMNSEQSVTIAPQSKERSADISPKTVQATPEQKVNEDAKKETSEKKDSAPLSSMHSKTSPEVDGYFKVIPFPSIPNISFFLVSFGMPSFFATRL
jgi:hypothetical protein